MTRTLRKRLSKKRNYKKAGLTAETEDGYLWGLTRPDGTITGEGISSDYIHQISDLITKMTNSDVMYAGKK